MPSRTLLTVLLLIGLISLLQAEVKTTPSASLNLTHWHQHRRQKRFILFENAGISKLVCGVTFPVDLGDKVKWRQLVLTMNLQYQFPVPPRPIYWWERWQDRALQQSHTIHMPRVDEAQLFLFNFIEQFLQQRQRPGRACLQRLICENAQIHHHNGLYAELLHRVLSPHHSLSEDYLHAAQMGHQGGHCQAAFAKGKDCLIEQYLHVREEYFGQTFLI